jgi:hypothetical protein
VRIVFRILNLLVVQAPGCEAKDMSLSGGPLQIAMGHADYYVSAHHETASQFVGQKVLRLIIQHPNRLDRSPLEADNSRWTSFGRSGSMAAERCMSRERNR